MDTTRRHNPRLLVDHSSAAGDTWRATGYGLRATGARLDIFDLDRALVAQYEGFARSFSRIKAPEIAHQVDESDTGLAAPAAVIAAGHLAAAASGPALRARDT